MSLAPDLRKLEADLPACPQALMDLQRLLADDDTSGAEVATLIEQDMALAAAVVRTVNSAMFGLLHRVQTVGEAVLYLGTAEVAAITYATALRAAFAPTPALERLWRWSSQAGWLMGRSAQDLDLDPWRAHTAGLFARCGQAVLLTHMPGVYGPLWAAHAFNEVALLPAERAELGIHHAVLGSAMCASWGLAGDVVRFVRQRIEEPSTCWAALPAPTRDLLCLGRMVDAVLGGEALPVAAAQAAAIGGVRTASDWAEALHPHWMRLGSIGISEA